MYRSIFIDLDDTVWAFTENARDTFQDMYDKYHFDRYFRSFSHFYTLYSGKNEELWNEYGAGRITKDELNEQRFSYPLLQVYLANLDTTFLCNLIYPTFVALVVYRH